MSKSDDRAPQVFMACVPHVPFIALQERALNKPFWDAYEQEAARLAAFDPELVIVFGADHYNGQHLRLMPSFVIGQAAEALADDGGFPGRLDIPSDIALACADYLINHDFDVATAYAMEVDHGFSQVLHNFLGELDSRPVIPVFVNSLCHPRPPLKRCRQLGEAIGTFAKTLGKRVAFLGSGGLSHETGEVFPQYHEAPNDRVRDYLVHGGRNGSIPREVWLRELRVGLDVVSQMLIDKVQGVGNVSRSWDDRFIETFAGGDLTVFDGWTDQQIVAEGGNSAGEIRLWIAAAGAAKAAGAADVTIDFLEHGLPMGVAAVVARASS